MSMNVNKKPLIPNQEAEKRKKVNEALTYNEETMAVGIYYKDNKNNVTHTSVARYLNLSKKEENYCVGISRMWYTLIWEREVGGDYPEYIKQFFEIFKNVVSSGEEKTYARTSQFDNQENKELVFVKLKPTDIFAINMREKGIWWKLKAELTKERTLSDVLDILWFNKK